MGQKLYYSLILLNCIIQHLCNLLTTWLHLSSTSGQMCYCAIIGQANYVFFKSLGSRDLCHRFTIVSCGCLNITHDFGLASSPGHSHVCVELKKIGETGDEANFGPHGQLSGRNSIHLCYIDPMKYSAWVLTCEWALALVNITLYDFIQASPSRCL